MKVLVTGANGFVGSAVVERLRRDGVHAVRGSVRSRASGEERADTVQIGSLGPDTDWSAAVQGIDVVVHTAARVHMMRDEAADPLAAFREVNVAGSVSLARQAAQAGVRRLVFISSVKVNGEATSEGRPFKPEDPPTRPGDPYGISKFEAEQALREVGAQAGLEVVVIRPVLVYGPGVRANFESMMRWMARGVPLPLGGIRGNRRSLVALDNLCDLVVRCIDHPAAAGRVFFAADGDDVSTTDLLQRVAAALGTRARLLPVPPALLQAGAKALGKGDVAQRLCGSLQVDIAANEQVLGWRPPFGMDAMLAKTADAFRARSAAGAGAR